MWFLAWREIKHRPQQFALISGLVAVLAFLVFVMTGLAVGLGAAGVSGLQRLPADSLVYAAGVQHDLGRSALPAGDRTAIAHTAGAEDVQPIGFAMAQLGGTGHAAGHGAAVALVAVDPAATFAPAVLRGHRDGIVLDDRAHDSGLRVGDTVRVRPGGLALRVAGFADVGSIQHAPVGYLPLHAWQHLPGMHGRVSAFAVTGDASAAALRAAAPGLDPAGKSAAIAAVPGHRQEVGTIQAIRVLLFVAAALLIGVVFWILTLEKEGPLAVLRATGASRSLLLGGYLIQVLATTAVGVAAGAAGGLVAGQVMPATAFVLTAPAAGTAVAILLGVALAGSAASLRKLLSVDPLLSLGRTA